VGVVGRGRGRRRTSLANMPSTPLSWVGEGGCQRAGLG
jgi:hypothetical protein